MRQRTEDPHKCISIVEIVSVGAVSLVVEQDAMGLLQVALVCVARSHQESHGIIPCSRHFWAVMLSPPGYCPVAGFHFGMNVLVGRHRRHGMSTRRLASVLSSGAHHVSSVMVWGRWSWRA